MSKASSRSMLIAAGAILLIALIWLALLESKSSVRAVCRRINEFGYSVSPGDLYLQGYGSDMNIRGLLEDKGITREEADKLIELSKSCGFGGDVDRNGKVELLIWQADGQRVMLIYTVDGAPELVFFESISSGEASAIG